MPDLEASREILQETNVVLLRKSGELADQNNFEAWAYNVAFYEVNSYRRDIARDKHLFDDELLTSHAELAASLADDRYTSLEECLKRLHSHQREMIIARYHDDEKVKALADRFNRTASAVETQLFRFRQALMDCIVRRIRSQTTT